MLWNFARQQFSARKEPTAPGNGEPIAAARSLKWALASRHLPILLGSSIFAIALILWHALAVQEDATIERKLELLAASVKIELTNQMQERILSLVAFAKRWENSSPPPQAEWEADTAFYLQHYADFQAIEWVDSSFGVRSIVPHAGDGAAQNLNLAKDQRRRIAEEVARNQQQVTITRSLSLVQGGKGFLVCVPIFWQAKERKVSRTVAHKGAGKFLENLKSFDGFILGVFRTEKLFENILHDNITRGYAIAIFDGDELIYQRPEKATTKNFSINFKLADYLFPKKQWLKEQQIYLNGVTWHVKISPTSELLARERSPLPEVVLAAGLVLSFLLALAVHLTQKAQLQKRQIEEINQQLEREIADRDRAQKSAFKRAKELDNSEEALRNQTRILPSVLDSMGEGVIVADERGQLIIFNLAAQKMHGIGITETTSEQWADKYNLFLPDMESSYAPSEIPLVRSPRGEEVNETEIFVVGDRSPHGIWESATARPLKDESGAIRGAVVVIREITERKQSEAELQKSEERFRSLSACSPVGIFLTDVEGRCTYTNPRCQAICGFTLEESLGEGWGNSVYPDDRQKVLTEWSNYTRQGREYSDEFRFQTKEGIVRWVHVRSSPMFSDKGQPLGHAGTIEDISDRKTVEAALRQSEQRFRFLAESIPQQVWTAKPNGELNYVNQRTLDYFERSQAQMLGAGWQQVLHPDDLAPCVERWSQSLKTGEPYEIEFRLLRASDLTYRWHIGRALPMHDESGRLVSWFGTNTDINDYKKAEQERILLLVREQAARAEAEAARNWSTNIIESITDAFFTLDNEWRFTYLNRQAEPLLARTREELLGNNFWEEFPHAVDSKFYRKYRTAQAQQVSVEFEEFFEPLNKWFAVHAYPSKDGLSVYLQDISDRKRAEEALYEQRERFRNLVETTSEWVWEVNENGIYTYVSPKIRDLLGYEPSDLLGKTPFDLMPKEEAFRVANIFGPIAAIQKPFSFLENANLHKNGHLVVLETSGVPFFDANGKFKGYRGIDRDITERKRTEEALRHSEEMHRLLVEGVKDYAIFMLDPSGHVVSWNAGAERIKGYRSEEIIGKHFSCYYESEDIQQGKPEYLLEQAAANGRVEDEGWRVRKDGSRFWANVAIGALRDESGQLCGFSKMTRDITDRKWAQEALRESEERYRSVIDAAAEGIVLLYADGSVSTCNLSAERILGLDAEQISGRFSLIPRWSAIREDGSTFPAELHPAIVTLRTSQPLSDVVMGVRKPDGMVTWISVNTRPLFRTGESAPYGVVFSFFDISDRKQSEEVLRLSDEILKQMPDAIYLTDLQGIIQKWMGKSEQIFGYSASEAIGKPISFMYRADVREEIADSMNEQIHSKGGFEEEISCLRKDGSEVAIETTAKTFYDKTGKPLFLVGLNRDITARKQAEEDLRQANQKLHGWVSDLEVRNREITMLGEISNVLQTCLTLEEAYTAIAQLVQPLFPDVSGAIFAISPSNNLVEAVTVWGDNLASQKLFAPHECWGLRRGRSHWVTDNYFGLACKHLHRHPNPSESLCIPMMAQGEALGLLYLSSQSSGRLSEAKQLLAVTVAEHIGLALANLKLRETLQNQSIRDPLTDLFNRRYLEESLEREVRRVERKRQSLSVIMLDVDHFKKFNDTFGHDAGDEVLREVGVFFKKCLREADIACRYGGEEFMLIMPEASLEIARARAEQIREEIKHLRVQYRRQYLGAIALSIGVACFPEHGSTGETVIRAADAALYRAKQQGRDQVVTAS